MLSVSRSDVKPSDYPERTQIVSTETEGKTDNEFQYVVEHKQSIDGPHGRIAVLSRVRGPSIDELSEYVGVHNRFFYYNEDNGIGEIPTPRDHIFHPPEGMLDSLDAYIEEAKRVAGGSPAAHYERVETARGWNDYNK